MIEHRAGDFIRLVLRARELPPSAMENHLPHWITRVSAASRLLAVVAIFALVTQARIAVAAPVYELNERIEVNTLGSWDKAAIIEVGKTGGDHEGEFKVHYDGYAASYDRWLRAVYFRKVAGGAPAPAPPAGAGTTGVPTAPAGSGTTAGAPAGAAAGAGPRLGKYNINSYGAVGRPPLFLGHIELQAGGKYRISRRSSGEYYGEGAYAFDAATDAVQWLSGPCKDDGWSGTFTVERDGKTHKIRLKSTTIATNSTD
jgi:hypothetical protein